MVIRERSRNAKKEKSHNEYKQKSQELLFLLPSDLTDYTFASSFNLVIARGETGEFTKPQVLEVT
jgi:hypothetical protein